MLARCFFELLKYACSTAERALGQLPSTSSAGHPATNGPESVPISPPAELDVMLPKVCEALVLVTQCIITITLEADELKNTQDQGLDGNNLKTFFNEARSSDRGLVESLIGMSLLVLHSHSRTCHGFLPNRTSSLTRPIPSTDKLWKACRTLDTNTAIYGRRLSISQKGSRPASWSFM